MYKYNIVLLSYNKDVICVLDKNNEPNCKIVAKSSRRGGTNDILSHEPYLPTVSQGVFYNCSSTECQDVKINSITQIALRQQRLQLCYSQANTKYQCKSVKYFHYKDIDKLLFLTNNIRNKSFYLIDCFVYSDGGRICNRQDDLNSHAKLVDTANIVRPDETNVLSQEEFLCEQDARKINCDLNNYVPYADGLKLKKTIPIDKEFLLKTGATLAVLKYNCIDAWCGYSGDIKYDTRRFDSVGRVYRCYYAKKQQVCKRINAEYRSVYNERDWLST